VNGQPHVVLLLTAPIAWPRMFRGQARFLRDKGFRVTLVSSPGPDLERFAAEEGVEAISLDIAREPTPLRDLRALWRLWRLFRALRPDVVEAGTPKAGLLGVLAAWLAGVSCRVYTLHGLRLETARGPKRLLLAWTERLAAWAAQAVVCVSPSLRSRAMGLGLVSPEKAVTLGSGGVNGVDLERFGRALASPVGGKVLGFVGRFTRDKGVEELYAAFSLLRSRRPGLKLLMLGDFEDGDPVAPQVRRAILRDRDVLRPGFVDDPAPFFAEMDIVALPSYREGLPLTAMEAAAAGRPLVAARATGTVDAVADGVTGILVPPRDSEALAEAIESLLADPERARRMGAAARAHAEREFRPEAVWRARLELYRELAARDASPSRPGERLLKRAFDIAVAGGLLVLLAPLTAMTALVVRARLGTPVLFRQQRPGLNGAPFTVLKFRSMTDERGPTAGYCPTLSDCPAWGDCYGAGAWMSSRSFGTSSKAR
jgi:glycosyltransferase involved in cell wall biosynthesis